MLSPGLPPFYVYILSFSPRFSSVQNLHTTFVKHSDTITGGQQAVVCLKGTEYDTAKIEERPEWNTLLLM
jgi:hypothetical protein